MIEIYKDIIGYEELYKVSNLGNVKNIKEGNKSAAVFIARLRSRKG